MAHCSSIISVLREFLLEYSSNSKRRGGWRSFGGTRLRFALITGASRVVSTSYSGDVKCRSS